MSIFGYPISLNITSIMITEMSIARPPGPNAELINKADLKMKIKTVLKYMPSSVLFCNSAPGYCKPDKLTKIIKSYFYVQDRGLKNL
jgi:hypothetical protein